MKFHRRHSLALPLALLARPTSAASRPEVERDVVVTWYRLILELVRHTATYSPPVAARAFAYIGVTAHEAMASGNAELRSLAGQVNGLTAPPPPVAGEHTMPACCTASRPSPEPFRQHGPPPARDAGDGASEAAMARRVSPGILARITAPASDCAKPAVVA